MADGTMHGENTSCKDGNSKCPELRLRYHDGTDSHGTSKFTLAKHIAPKYGEYVDFYGTLTFSEEQISPDNAYYTLGIRGPGKCTIHFYLLFSLQRL